MFFSLQCCVYHRSHKEEHPPWWAVAGAWSVGDLRSLELWDAEDGLHDGAEVAAVAQVLETRVPGAVHGLQLRARLLNHFPLTHPGLDVIVPEPILCLGQSHGGRQFLNCPHSSITSHELFLILTAVSAIFPQIHKEKGNLYTRDQKMVMVAPKKRKEKKVMYLFINVNRTLKVAKIQGCHCDTVGHATACNTGWFKSNLLHFRSSSLLMLWENSTR